MIFNAGYDVMHGKGKAGDKSWKISKWNPSNYICSVSSKRN